MEQPTPALVSLNDHEARTAVALFDRIFPADEHGPSASEIGVVTYVDRALAGAYRDKVEAYRLGFAALDRAARQRCGVRFADCDARRQDALLGEMEQGTLPDFRVPSQREFFEMLRKHLQEGLFSDPAYGGNRDKLGWRFLGHPGVWLENSEEESLSPEPATKGGIIQSLEDVGYTLKHARSEPEEIPGYDPQKSVEAPNGPGAVCHRGGGGGGWVVGPHPVPRGFESGWDRGRTLAH
jgi:gluconate 2-dehydrogenase alpha chain